MNLTVHQNITIHTLKVGGVSNSSVFQIGSAGMIKALSQFFNTGGFTKPAPPAGPQPVTSQYLLSLIEPSTPTTSLIAPPTTSAPSGPAGR